MDITFNKNEDHNKLQLSELKKHLSRAKLGGGKARIERRISRMLFIDPPRKGYV